MSSPLPEPIQTQIQEALFKGNKIEAIKIHREATSMGLKESKEAVEAIEATLRSQYPDRFPKSSAGCSAVAGIFLIVGMAVYFLFK